VIQIDVSTINITLGPERRGVRNVQEVPAAHASEFPHFGYWFRIGLESGWGCSGCTGSGSSSGSGPTAFVNISVRTSINWTPVSGIQQLHHHHHRHILAWSNGSKTFSVDTADLLRGLLAPAFFSVVKDLR